MTRPVAPPRRPGSCVGPQAPWRALSAFGVDAFTPTLYRNLPPLLRPYSGPAAAGNGGRGAGSSVQAMVELSREDSDSDGKSTEVSIEKR